MDIEARYLNRKDMKALNKAGLNPMLNNLDATKSMDLVDFIIDLKYSDVEGIDELPYYQVLNLAKSTVTQSMLGKEQEVKNS